ncbi:PRC-barrel domain containing protein [Niveispirillum sp. SYP-B3756]|uniref:PRC-barrel domain-containing protein n=1 Tax=Niveispirillum sp. SYP-B3756 TaxID=2662178 RepID=UPI001291FB1A|nr:PRC-barrel domain-containing protein [Niveispirillum sp. SYP-B3756]MQP67910.1 PRC-barrel domain containing protein [Niveispirillum sp. SYP-B3756]
MKRFNILLAGVALATLSAGSPAFAQGTPQTIALTQVDPTTLATGYRTSKVVGSTVYNAMGETVGTIDDLIVTPNDKVPFAVLSVGGFLGVGSKYVVVSYAALNVSDKKFILRDATKASLKSLPEYKYAP